MIAIKNVNKWYGDFQVLTECSTEVKKGEVVVVCGPSGSGKSTLIKCVNALEPFQQGDIVVDGTSIADVTALHSYLRSKQSQFHRTLAAKLLGYALGRPETIGDTALLAQMATLLADGAGLAELAESIVTSTAKLRR